MMKKLMLLCAAFGMASIAHAQPLRLVNHDGSVYSELCIASVQTQSEFKDLTAARGIADMQKNELRCNGLNVERFAAKLRSRQTREETSYVFSLNDESDVSKLCLAAVRSEQEYLLTRETLFDNNLNVEAEVFCNGLPIRTFARKYRSAGNLTVSSR